MRFRRPIVRTVRPRGRVSVGLLLAAVSALLIGGLSAPAAQASDVTVRHSCPTPALGSSSCFALQRTDINEPAGIKAGSIVPLGLGANDLQGAYNLSSAKDGAGQTVAIVDAFNDPSAETDLSVYRAQYGLPACTTANGCFSKVNQDGALTPLPKNHGGWADEISLDVDMVSAICPNCKILLIETNSSANVNLFAGVDLAVKLGAKFVSTSWGNDEYPTEILDDATTFDHPGVAITASSGAGGADATYPAASTFVTAVGGTSLTASNNSRGWAESAWSGSGSGCSAYETKPAWQPDGTKCATRAVSDVSAVADPATGVAVYETYGDDGWQVYGGTSVGAPIVAALYALAGTPAADARPASFPYSHAGSLTDITTGSNGSCGAPLCDAGPGWDGPTGLGTPNGDDAFSAAGPPPAPNTVTVTAPPAQTGTVGTPLSLQIRAGDSDGSQTLAYTASGLPDGLSIDKGTGLITGTPTSAGSSSSTVTATDTTGASGSATFSTTVSPAPNKISVADPGPQGATVGTAFSLQLKATDSDPSQTLAYTATGLPDGLSIDPASGLITGTPTTTGTSTSTVTATDGTGVSGSVTFGTTVSPAPNTVTVATPGNQTAVVGTAFSLQIKATDSAANQTLSYSAAGLPTGLGIDPASGLISGTPTATGSFLAAVTATDGTGVIGSTSFTTTVSPAPNTVTLADPGSQTATVGTAFSLQIKATDSDPSQTFSYTATGLPAGLSLDPASGLISGTPTSDGPASITVTATDGTGVSASITFKATVNPACTPAQLLGNPGFETGTAAPWTTTPGVVTTGGGQTAHSGTYFAWMDGYGATHTDAVSQTVTIPSKCTKTTLTFWLKVVSAETTTTSMFDKMTVKVGADTLATYSNLDKGPSYVQRTISLAPYAGQTVTLTFTGSEDSSVQTSFLLDDTAISTS